MKKEPEAPENHERWLISYADFITLLMVFFVVMYAMSQVDVEKYKVLGESLGSAMGGGQSASVSPGGPGIGADGDGPGGMPGEFEGTLTLDERQLLDMKEELETYLGTEGLTDEVTITMDPRGLVIALNDTVLYDTGSATVKPAAKEKLEEIGRLINKLDNYIRVEGHTDDRPIKTAQFPSNWELSAARATSVVRLFIDQAGIPPEKLVAVGYAEYRPRGDNTTAEGRAANRRVDIMLLSSKFNELEAQQDGDADEAEASPEPTASPTPEPTPTPTADEAPSASPPSSGH